MSPQSKRSKRPALSLSKVPPVKQLIEELGFQRASLREQTSFLDAVHKWRKSYRTEGGLAATKLLDWNLSDVQMDLHIAAERFLESDGFAERFWSPTRAWIHDANDLQYPSDRSRIIELLKQLFWRQNRYAFNNSKYNPKGTESRDPSHETTTPGPASLSHTTVPSITAPKHQRHDANAGREEQYVTAEQLMTRDTPTRLENPQCALGGSPSAAQRDIFEIPDDSGDDHGSSRNPSTSQLAAKHWRAEQDLKEKTQGKKRKNQPVNLSPPRRTGRKRVPRVPYSLLPDDEFENLLVDYSEDEDSDGSQRHEEKRYIFISHGAGEASKGHNHQKTRQSDHTKEFSAPQERFESGPDPKATSWEPLKGNPFKAPIAPMTSSEQRADNPFNATAPPPSGPNITKIRIVDSTSQTSPQHSTSQPASTRNSYRHPYVTSEDESPPSQARYPPTSSSGKIDREYILANANKKATQSETESRDQPPESLAGESSGGHWTLPSPRPSFEAHALESLSTLYDRAATAASHDPQQAQWVQHPSKEQASSRASTRASFESPATQSKLLDTDLQSPLGTEGAESTRNQFMPARTEVQDKISPTPNTPSQEPTTNPPPPRAHISQPIVPDIKPTMPDVKPTVPNTKPSSLKPTSMTPESTLPNSEPSTSKSRPKTQIPLWIITREPRYTEERWDDGKFQGTPLSDFLEGISQVTQRSHIEKIKLTLRTPTFDTKITVFKDAEDSWVSAKEKFVEKLKEAKAKARLSRGREALNFEILVEPFYQQGMEGNGSVDDDDEEFDF